MKALSILRQEHRLILRMVETLMRIRKKMENGAHPDPIFFEKALEFMRAFADKYHHYKEEFVLFGMISQKRTNVLEAEMSALRYQHERCRQCTAEIENALQAYTQNDEMAATIILEYLATYTSLLKRHIYIEDHLFFPAAEKALLPAEDDHLLSLFQIETQQDGPDNIQDQYEKLLESLEKMA